MRNWDSWAGFTSKIYLRLPSLAVYLPSPMRARDMLPKTRTYCANNLHRIVRINRSKASHLKAALFLTCVEMQLELEKQ